MSVRPLSPKEAAWALVIFMVTVLYTTLSLARAIWEFLLATFSYSLLCRSIASLFLLVVLLFLLYLIFKVKERRLSPYFFILSLGLVTFYCTRPFPYPTQWVHFLEYALLAFLMFNALRHDVRGRDLYTYSALLVFCIGLGDEVLQSLLPTRAYENKDLLLNSLGGFSALLLQGFILEKEDPGE